MSLPHLSSIIPLPQTSPPPFQEGKANVHTSPQDNDYLESLQNIPSNFELALNGSTNRTFLSPRLPKAADSSLLDPEAFRRLSISTISSYNPQSRSVSPYHIPAGPRSFKTRCKEFWDRNYGLFLVALSQLFGALMNVTTRLLELEGEGMHPLQILFARMGLTMLFCCLWMWWREVPDFPWGKKEVRWLLMARGFSGFFGIYGMYYSLQYLPVADAVVITFLAPSVAAYACYIFLKEPYSRPEQYASLISLLGVVLIARPTSLFTSFSSTSTTSPSPNSTSTSTDTYPAPTSSQRLSAVLVALLGVLGAAGAFTTIRWIGHRAHPLLSVNYFAIFCTFISTSVLLLPLPSTPSFALPVDLKQWGMLLFLGVCGFIMQYLLTQGLAGGGRDGGGRGTNMIYINMLFALGLDRVVFGVVPGWLSLAGSGLILGSAVFVAMGKGEGQGVTRGRDEEGGIRMGQVSIGRGEGTVEEETGLMRGRQLDVELDDQSQELSSRHGDSPS
ncbi:hypothetical protein BJ875DRAFT_83502 [Amylocarpus encephaloides]|uniref:EamA domain-containing protein n=1 Tax=Amylocarpus encephaloides TaxID=45428 RepID=A0A9P8CA65_9HELO|nr:hypothetical protein BJ875DRAFT_83502 [Amylocarpus encephaloides]